MAQQFFTRVALCAAMIALGGAGYTAFAYAGPGACDVSIDFNCQGPPPPVQGPPGPPRLRPIPSDQLTAAPQVPPPRDSGRLDPGQDPSLIQGPQDCGSNCPPQLSVTQTTPVTTSPEPNPS
jgi:hypothetical protein